MCNGFRKHFDFRQSTRLFRFRREQAARPTACNKLFRETNVFDNLYFALFILCALFIPRRRAGVYLLPCFSKCIFSFCVTGFGNILIFGKVPVFSASGGSKPPALPLATNFSEKQTYLTICILRCLFFALYFSPAVGQGFISCRILITVIFPFVRRVSETLYLPKSTVLPASGGSKPPALLPCNKLFRETDVLFIFSQCDFKAHTIHQTANATDFRKYTWLFRHNRFHSGLYARKTMSETLYLPCCIFLFLLLSVTYMCI